MRRGAIAKVISLGWGPGPNHEAQARGREGEAALREDEEEEAVEAGVEADDPVGGWSR